MGDLKIWENPEFHTLGMARQKMQQLSDRLAKAEAEKAVIL